MTELSFEDIGTFLFSVMASAVSSNPAYLKTIDLKDFPQSARLAVLKIYLEILPLDLKARVVVVLDSAEVIVKLVVDFLDIIGLLPHPATRQDLITLLVFFLDFTLDVYLEVLELSNYIVIVFYCILCDQYLV